jgi:hypothetical protein
LAGAIFLTGAASETDQHFGGRNERKGYSSIPSELFYWITFLSKALPTRSIGTFIELLIGSMLTTSGFVTEAYLILDMR